MRLRIFRYWFLLFLFTAGTTPGFGQFKPTPVQKSNNQIILEGLPYLLHEVRQGHTVYSISKAYGVTEEEIYSANPQLVGKPLPPGLVIRIPDKNEASGLDGEQDNGSFIYYDVPPKETLFSLSKKYGIKIDDIKEANPDLRWGLKAGTTIRIPRDKITLEQANGTNPTGWQDQAANVKAPESDIVVNQPCQLTPFPHINEDFNLAIILPLNINQYDTLTWTIDLARDTIEYFRFLEFLEGAYLAIDSMRMAGLSMNVQVFDSERNPAKIKEFIRSGKLDNVDLIIGPVYPKELEIAAPFSRSRQIPLVSPLSNFQEILIGNPFIFQVNNTEEKQEELTTQFIGLNSERNILIINRSDEKNSPGFIDFVARINQNLIQNDPAGHAKAKVLFYDEATRQLLTPELTRTDLATNLNGSKSNLVIIPSEEEVFVSQIVNQLNIKSGLFDIAVFGLPQWIDFNGIDISALFNINLEIISNFSYPFVDFSDRDVLEFCKKYRVNWNSEPSRFSFQGFDVTYYFLRALFYFGRNFSSSLPCWDEYLDFPALQTPISFTQLQKDSGFENQALPIIRYSKDELRKERMHVLVKDQENLN